MPYRFLSRDFPDLNLDRADLPRSTGVSKILAIAFYASIYLIFSAALMWPVFGQNSPEAQIASAKPFGEQ